jgi:uncharacterized membrane protein YccC
MICTIWVIPRFETLGMYLLIVFCVHGLAAWIAFGSERISYMGLQIALAFDLGVLTDYGPSTQIDPIRDRFIGIVLGILIISTVFSLVWPEDATSIARQKLAASLRAIARLLNARGGNESPEREGIELDAPSVIIAGVRGARLMSMLSDDGICMNTPVAIIARDLAEVTYKRRQNLFKGIFLR